MTYRLLYLLIFCFTGLTIQAQNFNYTLSDDSLVNKYASERRVYYAARTDIKPRIDGRLDDDCWQQFGTWDGGFIQQQPHQAAADKDFF